MAARLQADGQRMRSAIGSSLLSSYFIGTICAGFFGLAVLNWDSDWSWRLLNLLQAAGSVWMVVLILLRKMVESPRWLVKVGRVQEAHEVLAKMHANGQMDDELVVNELNEMKEVQLAADQSSKAGLKDFWATIGAKKRLFVVIVAAAGTQLSGSVLISAYLGYVHARLQVLTSQTHSRQCRYHRFGRSGLSIGWSEHLRVRSVDVCCDFRGREMVYSQTCF